MDMKIISKFFAENYDFRKTAVNVLKSSGKMANGLALVSLLLQVYAGAADPALSAFRSEYPLNPVRGYTFLGTEKSTYHVDSLYREFHRNLPGVPVNKPCVLPDGRIDAWFNPGEHVLWVAEAMKSGHYEFSLVDGYLPAVRYIYHKEGTKLTCEMTAFAVDGEAPGSIFIHVSLVERNGVKEKSAQYFKVGTKTPSTKSEFDAALNSLRKYWEAFFASGAQIPIPDPGVLNASKASIIRALITYTGDNPHYGVGAYGHSMHDGFPPTTIALVHCLLDWGQETKAFRVMTNYFDDFISPEGEILYYGPSIAEYGQFLWLTRMCMKAGAEQEWIDHLRPKLEAIRQRLWAGQTKGPGGLIYGGPEADKRMDEGVYFHNNGWAWRGLRDIAPILGHTKEDKRCEAFKNIILEAIEQVTDRSGSIPFIPPMAEKTEFNIMTPFDSLTPGDFESYTNYRYWPELMSSGILSRKQMQAIIDYRKNYRGEIAGMTRFWGHADNWPIAEYAMGLMDLGKTDEVKKVLYSHLAGHMTPETWTAYEQVDIKGSPYRGIKADYCVPSQLVAPRLAAWLWGKNGPATKAYNMRSVKPKSIHVDGKLDENAWIKEYWLSWANPGVEMPDYHVPSAFGVLTCE